MVSPEIAIFAERVRRSLGHLTVEQVSDLTDGLEANVAASVADGVPLPDVDSYVAELLSAAGLETSRGPLDTSPIVRKARLVLRPIAQVAKRWTGGLAPMWWLARAFAVTVVIGAWSSTEPAWGGRHPFPAIDDRAVTGFVVFVALFAASVWWGRRDKVLPTTFRAIIGIVLALIAVVTTRDEFRWASNFEATRQRQPCYELGFDSRGYVALPKLPVPNLLGMDYRQADIAVQKWGRGLAVISAIPMGGIDQPASVVVDQQSAALTNTGGCPYIDIPVTFDVESPETSLPAHGTPTTTAPSATTTLTPTTTSIQLSVVPETTVIKSSTTQAPQG